MKKDSKKTKVCYALAYRDPKYIRTKSILNILSSIESIELIKAINNNKGMVRYLETPIKVLWVRLKYRPDVYIVGFSGYEIFWPVRLLTWPKPIIFDEFINAYDWFVKEHNKIPEGSLRAKVLRFYVKFILKSSCKVLTDTKLHAQSSSGTYGIKPDKYQVLYVGTDEELFQPVVNTDDDNKEFTVFFYGNFLPLHGVEYILGAAKKLRGLPIKFVIIGGADKNQEFEKFNKYIKQHNLKNVEHHLWVDFYELPEYITKADLCLGGPFGNTPQSQKVITGKTFQFLAMAKPVIIGNINEDVNFINKKNCLLATQGSVEEISKYIAWAYECRVYLEDIGAKGRELFDSKFSLSAQKKVLKGLITDIMS